MSKKIKTALLLTLGIAAIATRLIGLDTLPPSLHNDEASFLYNTQALLETGRDEDGRPWPLFLNSYIDPKPALISYMQLPFVKMLGTTTTASRVPTSLFGFLSLALVFLFVKNIARNENIALLTTTLLIFSPWHTVISRATQEVIVSFSFGLTALILLRTLFTKENFTNLHKRYVLFFMAFITASISMYTYHSAKIVLPALIIALLLKIKSAKISAQWSLFVGICFPLIALAIIALHPSSLDRYEAITILSDSKTVAIVSDKITTSTPYLPPLALRIFHNKVVQTALIFFENYASHFESSFFLFGNDQPTRYRIPYQGLLHFIDLPLALIGIFAAFNHSKKSNFWFWLFWLLLAPVPAALTSQEIPSSIRAFWMIVPLYVYISYSLSSLYEQARKFPFGKSAFLSSFIVLYAFHVLLFWHQARSFFPNIQPWNRNGADEALAQKLTELEDDYDKIVVATFTGQPYIYLALNNLIPLHSIQNSYPLRLEDGAQFGKYQFTRLECFTAPEENTLFAISFTCPLLKGFEKVTTAPFADGNNGYILVEYSPNSIQNP